MRVLFWTEVFWPDIGGTEVLGARLVTALRSRGHEIVVVASNAGRDLPDNDWFGEIAIRRFPFWSALRAGTTPATWDRFLETRRSVAGLRQDFAPEVVHVFFVAPGAFFLLETGRAHPAPLLVTMQQPLATFHLPGPRRLLERSLRAANWAAYCSPEMRAEVETLIPAVTGPSSVILNALEPPAATPTALPWTPPRLLCLGRLSTQKGFDLALLAFAELRSRFPELELVLAGDGPARGDLERLATDLGIGDRVVFRGWVSPESVPALINAATVVVMPSREEPFGLVALEAALQGRPVVAAAVGGLRSVIRDGETGMLVRAEDCDGLRAALARLLEEPERARQLGRTARTQALATYSWERYVDAYDALYQQLHTEVAHAGS